MEKYEIKDMKKIYDELHKSINDAIKRGNNYYMENNNPNYLADSWRVLQKSSEMISKTENEAWNKYYSKLEELYPGCLSSKEFARFYSSHLSQINRSL